MATAIYMWIALMRKQGRVDDAKIDKIKSKGHLTATETKTLKAITRGK